MIGIAAIVFGILFGVWLEGQIERCARERRRIKAQLPRRVG